MRTKFLRCFIFASCFFIAASLCAQTSLPGGIPEEEGVSSAGIAKFLDAAGASKNEFHSFVFLRHGKVIAEGWWNPYSPSLKQTVYSTSKTFTSTAVGFAISENKLRLTDKVISFFPNDLPDTISENLSMLTVKDVLMMSDGQDPDPTMLVGKYKNWVKAFLSVPVVHKPGSVFLYNSLGSFMLSAIVQKATGQKEIDYLKPRLFDPLGITGMTWEENLMGQNTGGWGLSLKTEDMAKLGQLYMQKGKWNGVQILPESWVAEATSTKIIQHPDLPQVKKDSSDWEQGYCYQIWRCRHNGYRADGAFGQYIIVLPSEDAVIAIQSETSNMQNELNLVWDYLLPSMKKNKLNADASSLATLKSKLSNLKIVPEAGSATAHTTNAHLNKYFVMAPNDNTITSLRIQITDSICQLIINAGADTYNLFYGAGFWKMAQTNKPGPSLLTGAKENTALLLPYKVASNFYWKDDQTLVLQMRYIESPHTEITTCHLSGNNITVDIERSFDYGSKKSEITGVLK